MTTMLAAASAPRGDRRSAVRLEPRGLMPPPRSSPEERQDGLTSTVVQSQGDIMARIVSEDVQRVDVANAAREVRLAGAELSQHDLDVLIDGVERHAEQADSPVPVPALRAPGRQPRVACVVRHSTA